MDLCKLFFCLYCTNLWIIFISCLKYLNLCVRIFKNNFLNRLWDFFRLFLHFLIKFCWIEYLYFHSSLSNTFCWIQIELLRCEFQKRIFFRHKTPNRLFQLCTRSLNPYHIILVKNFFPIKQQTIFQDNLMHCIIRFGAGFN